MSERTTTELLISVAPTKRFSSYQELQCWGALHVLKT